MPISSHIRTLRFFVLVLLVSATALSQKTIVELRDFRDQEVKAQGISLSSDLSVHIEALGGGTRRSFLGGLFGDGDDQNPSMYANGWILDAATREPVWEMTYRNTSGRSERRRYDDDVTLKKGSYEVYFAAYGYAKNDWNSNVSANIDRRPRSRGGKRDGSGDWNDRDLRDEFMNIAKEYGITLSVNGGDAATAETFQAPRVASSSVFAAAGLGDNAVIRKVLTVSRAIPIHLYAIGEGRRHDDMFDFGWIVNSDTRERVWQMTFDNTDPAGGAAKNRKFDGEVNLAKGTYELCFITDGSHSSDDWNSPPPYDPYRYGISVSASNDADAKAITVSDPAPEKNAIVSLVRVHDNDYVSAGFRLNSDTKLRVYALGEMGNDRDLADHGWITNAQTRERVWSMDRRDLYHAGGAKKNKFVDEIIAFPKGSYIAYYETDGSHSYDHWNDDAPFDPEHWGMTIYGSGQGFTPSSVTPFSEEAEDDVVAQIIRVGDDRDLTKVFTLGRPTKVRIYALGEGQDHHMYDFGWIEDTKSGSTVWEMTYMMTNRAGGATKNRLVNTTFLLDKGEYELHYETDGSHSFNNWNADPPEDRAHWGITLYKAKE